MTEHPPEHAPASPWSFPLSAAEVPETGRAITIEADAPTREAVAALAGLRTLPRLTATFDVQHRADGGLHVTGEVSAVVGQTCVVTLEPIENELSEPVDLVFMPEGAPPVSAEAEEDEIEVLRGGGVDLGAIATEFLVLGIDPYPRKPDAVFDAPAADDAAAHPFAALAALKGDRRD